MRKIQCFSPIIVLILILNQISIAASVSAVNSIELQASFSKIYKPDLASPQSCSAGSISYWREDGKVSNLP